MPGGSPLIAESSCIVGLENTPVLDKVTCQTVQLNTLLCSVCPEWRVCGAGEQMRGLVVGEGGSAGTGAKRVDPPPKGGREGAGADSRQILSPPLRGFQISPPRGFEEGCPSYPPLFLVSLPFV